MERLIAVFEKNSREQVRVMFRQYKGTDLLDLRVFWSKDGKVWRPSPKGLALRPEKLPVLLAALHKAAEKLGQDELTESQVEDQLLTIGERQELAKRFDIAAEDLESSVLDEDLELE